MNDSRIRVLPLCLACIGACGPELGRASGSDPTTGTSTATESATQGTPALVSPPRPEGSRVRFGLVLADPLSHTVSFPARVNQTNGVAEYLLVTEYGKTHESLLVTAALPMDIQSALLLLGARPSGTHTLAPAALVPSESRIWPSIAWSTRTGISRVPFHRLFSLSRGGSMTGTIRGPSLEPWLFNGSIVTAEGFGAHFEGSVIALIQDAVAILNNPGTDRDDDKIHVPDAAVLPPMGTAVSVELRLENKSISQER